MKYYIIAGEASGDLYGANLIKALRSQDPEAQFRFWGGDAMKREAGEPVRHIRDLAIMGFVEVVMHLRTVLGNISFCKRDIQDWKPDAVIGIDYPGFNLKIEKWAHEHGFKAIHYISPQLWAWKKGRLKGMRQYLDLLCYILPFEQDFYAKNSLPQATYVGHPLIEVINQKRSDSSLNTHPETDSSLNTHPETDSSLNTHPETDSSLNTHPETDSSLITHHETDSSLITHHETDSSLITHHETDSSLITHHETDSSLNTHPETDSSLITHHETDSSLNTHPETDSSLITHHSSLNKPLIALLPGSRRQEIKNSLPTMVRLANRHPEYQFVIAGMSLIGNEFYDKIINSSLITHHSSLNIAYDQTYALLSQAHAAVVCSGTATLETGLFHVPQVVCYRANPISIAIAKKLVGKRINHIALVNLIDNSDVVTELLQQDFNDDRLEQEFQLITTDQGNRDRMLEGYHRVEQALGASNASNRVAEAIIHLISSHTEK